jgi:hypothetical protein
VPAAAVKRIEQVYLSELGLKSDQVVVPFFNKKLGFKLEYISNTVYLNLLEINDTLNVKVKLYKLRG